MYVPEKFPSAVMVEKVGFLLAYLLSTGVIYLLLTFLHKIPPSWTIFHIVAITLSITLIGIILQKVLK